MNGEKMVDIGAGGGKASCCLIRDGWEGGMNCGGEEAECWVQKGREGGKST